MKLRSLGALALGTVAVLALAPRAFAQGSPDASAPDAPKKDPKGTPSNAQFAEYTPDPNDAGVPVGIRLKDSTVWPLADNLSPERKRKVVVLLVTLQSNSDVIIYIDHGKLVDLAKGRMKRAIDTLPDALKAKIKDTKEGDEVVITTARIFEGQVFKISDTDGLTIHPRNMHAAAAPKPGEAAAPDKASGAYDLNSEMTIGYHEIVAFVNKSAEQRAVIADLNKSSTGALKDAVDRMSLHVLDTVRVGFLTGRVEEITPETLKVKEWKLDGTWGEVKPFDRKSLPEVTQAWLKHKRSYPITTATGQSEVVLEEERIHQSSATPAFRVKGSVWHDQKDLVLAGAILEFVGGAANANWSTSPLREDIQVEPVFAGDRVVEERTLGNDAEDGEVKLDFNPAKHMIAATSPDAKTYALRALATKTDPTQLACVWAFVSRANDPEFALLLAYQYGALAQSADNERVRASLLEAIQSFGDVGTQAIVDDLMVPDGAFRIPEAQPQGTINWRSMSDQAGNLKKRELELLDRLPGSAKGDRGKKLFDLYEDRGTEFAEPVMKIFNSRTNEAIDALLEVAISTSALSNPTSDAIKRAEHATDLIRRLGDKALYGLCDRIERQGKQGLIEARKLRQMVNGVNPTPVPDVIQIALERLIEWRRKEWRDALDRSLEEAHNLGTDKKWVEALAKVEDIIKQDRDNAEAKKLLYQSLVRVAEQEYSQKHRGDASLHLRRVIDDKAKGFGAEPLLAKILLEAAREDAVNVCIRNGPLETYELIRNSHLSEVFQIANLKSPIDTWIPVKLNKDGSQVGWLYQGNALATNGGASCSVTRESADPLQVRKLLAQVVELAPELKPIADVIDGDFWLRDAEAKYANAQYEAALASYDSASKLSPDDPRLVNRKWCQLRVNAMLLGIFGGGVVVLAILGGILSLRRQKRVVVSEFRYYGKDRARAERELDSKPTEPTDGAPAEPAPAPAGEAPTS